LTVVDSLWAQLKARHTAQSAVNTRAPEFLRESDSRENVQTDSIFVTLTARAIDRTLPELWSLDVVMACRVRRQDDFVLQAALLDAVRTAFSGWTPTPTDGSGWVFSPLIHVAEQQAASSDTQRVAVLRFSVFANRAGSPYFGTQADVSGYSGGRAFFWQYRSMLDVFNDTPPDVDKRRYVTGERHGDGVMRFYVTGLPPRPGAYTVTFTLATGVTLVRDVIVRTVDLRAAVGSGEVQVVDAPFVVNGGDEDGF